MSANSFNLVVPGKVYQTGIESGENLQTSIGNTTSPAHFPEFAAITPKGELERRNVPASIFFSRYGNIADSHTPFYNPISFGISKLISSGQDTFSFKRLTFNTVKARLVWGIVLFEETDVPTYKRDDFGDYEYDALGQPVKTGTHKGRFASTGYVNIKSTSEDVGLIKTIAVTADSASDVPEGTKGKFYPLVEFISGVGDAYNNMYATLGHGNNVDWDAVGTFVLENGVYPFNLRIGEVNASGMRIDATTGYGLPDSTFTLFESQSNIGIKYGVRRSIGEFTGSYVNRPVERTDAPFEDAYVYQDNVNLVCNALYQAEYTGEDAQDLPGVLTNKMSPHAIMNPIDFKNHFGKPYHNVVFVSNPGDVTDVTISRFSSNHYLQASGGISPWLDKDGKYPPKPATWIEQTLGEWVTDPASPIIPSKMQYWQMNQILLEEWFTNYADSKDFKDVIRNRTSFIWDLGYNQSIKDIMIGITAKRKDIMIVPCCTEWLRKRKPEEHYSIATMLNAKATAIPETEKSGGYACRVSINLWDARYIDEDTWERFSLNIENMCAYAEAGGSSDGRVIKENMPDYGENKVLRIAHDPQIQFELDEPSANNLLNGCISVTAYNEKQYCRAAMPTVFRVTDSVLKDQPNVWYGVVIEKIMQDEWIKVSGDTHLSSEGYLSTVRDNATAEIKNRLGSLLSGYSVVTEFREDKPNSRSVMYSRVIYYVGKAKYMLYSTLEARNEQDMETAGA